MNVKKFKTRYFFNRLWYSNSENVVSEISLEESPLGVSFSYDYKTNKVRLDGSSFWFPMSHYSGNIPKYLKFGETAMLARVMAKAFDATGSLYDAHGRKWDKALLPQTLRDEHTYYTECLMSQLSSSDYWFAEINNTEYINTIAADMGSFLVPYESFKTYLMNATEEKSLPSVNLDQKQMFYVQVAQKYCEVRAPSIDSEEIVGLSKRSRVNIAVSNMEDFAFVFNCQPQHVLNLQHKCNLSS
ncbi:endothelin-converting enzyme 1 isoform X2 [Parasteatoda tepidariorum]|uniref:endothelin-converting enzyme 1 isoform X2 n=1 Tax=Parasteatoda tepidariorum TaxID=114398 RepID=UPI001C721DC7|nr:endothelin-converting enzyme 1-like isoform X2 [Parasteatoda tepidariorum]